MIRPLHDRVLIELEPPPVVENGIIIPDPDKAPVRVGKVLSTGPGKRTKKGHLNPTQVKVGDRVAFFMAVTQTQQGYAVAHRLEENQGLIAESDILFVLEGDVKVSV